MVSGADRRYVVLAVHRLETDEMTAKVTTDSNSPWFSGHFPGDPILPGIAQLEMVAEVISSLRQEKLIIGGLNRVKFRKLIRPGELLDIHAADDKNRNKYSFRVTCRGETVCSGLMTLVKKTSPLSYE